MKIWMKISLLLCTFGFLRELRPSEPFVVEFLSGEWRNITSDEINRIIYPIGTYSHLFQIVIIFLITDILRYKPVIVISACCGILMCSLLLWTDTIEALMAVQAFYGTFMASEVAYYTYMYAKVNKEHYQKVTSHTRTAILCGKFLSGVLAQLLVSFNLLDFRQLNFISFGSQCLSFLPAILLPSVATSMYFYVQINPPSIQQNDNLELKENKTDIFSINNSTPPPSIKFTPTTNIITDSKFSYQRAFKLLWCHFKTSYSNNLIVMWSIWWAIGTCGMFQVDSYIQFIWQAIEPNEKNLYNGAAIAIVTFFGALSAFVVGFVNSKYFDNWDMYLITGCSLIQAGLVLWISLTESLIAAYIGYILFGAIYHFLITVASLSVAKLISNECFALVFGFNTFWSLALQSILTVIVVSQLLFTLDIRNQFYVYAGYFLVLAIIYGAIAVIRTIRNRKYAFK